MNKLARQKRVATSIVASALVVLFASILTIVIVKKNREIVGLAVAPAVVMEVTPGQRAVYAEASDSAHEAWKSPDPTQRSETVVRRGSIMMLNAGLFRDSREQIPEYCDVEIGAKILKLAPTHDGFIAVKYIAPPMTPIWNPVACEDGVVTLMNTKALNYFIGPSVLR